MTGPNKSPGLYEEPPGTPYGDFLAFVRSLKHKELDISTVDTEANHRISSVVNRTFASNVVARAIELPSDTTPTEAYIKGVGDMISILFHRAAASEATDLNLFDQLQLDKIQTPDS